MPPEGVGISGISSDNSHSSMAKAWSLKDVSWGLVFKCQDYVNLILTIGFIIGVVVAIDEQNYTVRPFLDYDATISFPYTGSSTIPYWLAIVLPLLLMVASFFVGELALAKHWHGGISSAVASLIFFILDGISAFIVTGFATQVTKVGVGRLRPDFLDRCRPANQTNIVLEWGQPASANPVCIGNPAVDEGEMKDGHYSFPSGHTSTVFVFAVYGAAYCTWAFYTRANQHPAAQATDSPAPYRSSSGDSAAPLGHRTAGNQLRSDALSTLGFVWILCQMAFAWAVGASRITDFKHHPSDVVGGALLGSAVALLYVLRAIPRHRRLIEGRAAEEPLLPPATRVNEQA